ncbi:heterogeneous nuclear ribonucleoprotein A0-like [Eucyclogobius newberryi]|uniref:heterogeneous nuclear ribonucleoprotein A0-like n=1 Tax=Eucyclogobius newberryi TaxID=166745 RepID=UPI003B5A4009
MSSKLCKLFVGGLNVQTDNKGLREYFQQYGNLTDCVVVMNQNLGRSRCFGFITFSTPEEADVAMAVKPHVVDGNTVELKRAIAREDTNNPDIHANVKKIFVGGLKDHIESDHMTQYFSQFGTVEKAEIISDKQTGKKRGFGFVYFCDCDSATKAAIPKFHEIEGNKVEVKKAQTKQELATRTRGRGRGGMQNYGGGRGGGGYGSYGQSYGSGYGDSYGYGGGYGTGSYDAYSGYGEYDTMGGGYSNGDFGDGYGQQASGYGPMKAATYSYRSAAPYSRGGASVGAYTRGAGFGSGGGY